MQGYSFDVQWYSMQWLVRLLTKMWPNCIRKSRESAKTRKSIKRPTEKQMTTGADAAASSRNYFLPSKNRGKNLKNRTHCKIFMRDISQLLTQEWDESGITFNSSLFSSSFRKDGTGWWQDEDENSFPLLSLEDCSLRFMRDEGRRRREKERRGRTQDKRDERKYWWILDRVICVRHQSKETMQDKETEREWEGRRWGRMKET